MEIKFNACEHLDYADEYVGCTKELVTIYDHVDLIQSKKVFWYRKDARLKGLPVSQCCVQFCKKRGRLNDRDACLKSELARCNLYNETVHTVTISDS